jgi:hypothetical protein
MRHWTEEERQKQARAIRKWKPWQNSSGPKTDSGKKTAAQNALKHGLRSQDGIELRRLMNEQRLLVQALLKQLEISDNDRV